MAIMESKMTNNTKLEKKLIDPSIEKEQIAKTTIGANTNLTETKMEDGENVAGCEENTEVKTSEKLNSKVTSPKLLASTAAGSTDDRSCDTELSGEESVAEISESVGDDQYFPVVVAKSDGKRCTVASDGYNSEDEYNSSKVNDDCYDKNAKFLKSIKLKGWRVVKVMADGSCLFRSVALQIYGNEYFYDIVRENTMNYIEQHADKFKPFITEDFEAYVERKRRSFVYGNAIEIVAISEIYNRCIEIYKYESNPFRIFRPFEEGTGNGFPLRLHYVNDIHYDAILNPLDIIEYIIDSNVMLYARTDDGHPSGQFGESTSICNPKPEDNSVFQGTCSSSDVIADEANVIDSNCQIIQEQVIIPANSVDSDWDSPKSSDKDLLPTAALQAGDDENWDFPSIESADTATGSIQSGDFPLKDHETLALDKDLDGDLPKSKAADIENTRSGAELSVCDKAMDTFKK